MKVLILSNHLAGLFKFRKEVIESILAENTVYISVPDMEFADQFKDIGCNIIKTPCLDRRGTNPFQDLKLYRYYVELIKKLRPNVVLTYTIKPNIYGGLACKKKHLPVIANITGLGTSLSNGGILQVITLSLYRIGIKNARKIFFQNYNDLQFMLANKVVQNNYDVLPGSGVNIEDYKYEPYPPESKDIIFLIVGRIMKDKGTDEILEAAATIKKIYPHCIFQFIGSFDGNYQNKIELAIKMGVITYYEHQDDIHSFYKNANAIIHASYHEGMSNVLLEAAATGRPVIATNVPGCRETYDDGVSGIGFDPQNTDALIQAIKKFIALPYEKKASMGLSGRKRIVSEFNRQIVVNKYVEEIRNLSKEG